MFGHEKVSILDGGLPKWLKDGYPVVAGPQGEVTVCTYSANYNGSLVRSYEEILANHSSKTEQVKQTIIDMCVLDQHCNNVLLFGVTRTNYYL